MKFAPEQGETFIWIKHDTYHALKFSPGLNMTYIMLWKFCLQSRWKFHLIQVHISSSVRVKVSPEPNEIFTWTKCQFYIEVSLFRCNFHVVWGNVRQMCTSQLKNLIYLFLDKNEVKQFRMYLMNHMTFKPSRECIRNF